MKKSKKIAVVFAASVLLSTMVSQNLVFAKTKHSAKTTITVPTVSTVSTVSTTIPWGTTLWNGYGSVTWDTALQALRMSPKAATQPGETHSAFVVSNATYTQPFQLSYTMNTTKQLRTGSTPNPWEVGWAVFGYKTDGKFKYLALKANGYGVEMGESLLSDAQNFLYTSEFGKDLFPINTNYNVVVTAQNNVITVTVNGRQYAQYAMSSKDVLNADGKLGFYTEDASVQVSNIKMVQL